MEKRTYLFLQGPLSPWFTNTGKALEERGHSVRRINFNIGDWIYWHGKHAHNYRGKLENWPAFITAFLTENAITDIVCHADQRAYHKATIEIAKTLDINIWVTELGLLRPDFLTLEPYGLSIQSHAPNNPDTLRVISQQAPPIATKAQFKTSFWKVAAPDVAYNLANTLFFLPYRHYKRHTIHNPLREYSAWVMRLLTEKQRNKKAEKTLKTLEDKPFILVPMQLEGDFQLRANSQFVTMANALDYICKDFADNAPNDHHLLLKSHPLDSGLENWPKHIKILIQKYSLQKRIHFADGGTLEPMVQAAKAVLTVNSTAGLEALQKDRAVKTLSPTLFDMEGLTDQQPLKTFWAEPTPPNMVILSDVLKALAYLTQIKGSIYDTIGLQVATQSLANALEMPFNERHEHFLEKPPRSL